MISFPSLQRVKCDLGVVKKTVQLHIRENGTVKTYFFPQCHDLSNEPFTVKNMHNYIVNGKYYSKPC